MNRILIGALNTESGQYIDLVKDTADHAKIVKNHLLANRDLYEFHFYGQPRPTLRSKMGEESILTSHEAQEGSSAPAKDPIFDPTVDQDSDEETDFQLPASVAGLTMPGIPDFKQESLTRAFPPPSEEGSKSVKIYSQAELKDMPDEGILDLLCVTYKQPVPAENTKRSDMIKQILTLQDANKG